MELVPILSTFFNESVFTMSAVVRRKFVHLRLSDIMALYIKQR